MENNELKKYYDQQYNKDGQGPPFEQLTQAELNEISETVLFRCFVFEQKARKIQGQLNYLAIKETQKNENA